MYLNVREYTMTTDAMGYMPKVSLRASSMNGNMSAKKKVVDQVMLADILLSIGSTYGTFTYI